MSKRKKDKNQDLSNPQNRAEQIHQAIEDQLMGSEEQETMEVPPWENRDPPSTYEETVTETLLSSDEKTLIHNSSESTTSEWDTSVETVITGSFQRIHADDFGGQERLFSDEEPKWKKFLPSFVEEIKNLWPEKGSLFFSALKNYYFNYKIWVFSIFSFFVLIFLIWFAAFRSFESLKPSSDNTQSFPLPVITNHQSQLRIETNPKGAKVFINGLKKSGLTPIELNNLNPNEKILVQIQKEGFESVQENLMIKKDKNNTLRFELIPLGFLFRAKSQPEGASVFMNQEFLGKTPLEKFVNPNGKRVVFEYRLAGYRTFKTEVAVPSKPLTIAPNLVALSTEIPTKNGFFGFLSLDADPVAIVYLNGRRLNSATPIDRLKLKPGKYNIRFMNPQNKKTKTRHVTVREGKHRQIRVNLR